MPRLIDGRYALPYPFKSIDHEGWEVVTVWKGAPGEEKPVLQAVEQRKAERK